MDKYSAKLDKIIEQISAIRENQARLNEIIRENREDIIALSDRLTEVEDRQDIQEIEAAKWKGVVWAAGIFCGLASGVATLCVQIFIR